MGKKPKEATAAVIITGLKRNSKPFFKRSSTPKPSLANCLKKESNTIPFKTATPNKAINPIPAETENGIPRNQRATTPPIADKGIAK